MKKIAIRSALALTLLLVLSACGGSDNTSDTSTNTIAQDTYVVPDPEPAPIPEPVYSSEDEYLYALHSMNDPYIESTTDADLVEIGNTICSALDEGNSIMDLVTYLATNGTFENTEQAEAAGMIIAASATTLCSEYTSDVQDFITQNS